MEVESYGERLSRVPNLVVGQLSGEGRAPGDVDGEADRDDGRGEP